jgi:hypothetical protein
MPTVGFAQLLLALFGTIALTLPCNPKVAWKKHTILLNCELWLMPGLCRSYIQSASSKAKGSRLLSLGC